MNLEKCRILVTGSAKRIGKHIARELAAHGASPILHAHKSRDDVIATAADIEAISGLRPLILYGDLSRRNTWIAMDREIEKNFGRLDVWVQNASVFYATPFFSATNDDWQQFMDINLKAAFLGAQILGKRMMAEKHGKIIGIGDVAAKLAWPSYLPYAVSKAGMGTLMKGLAQLMAPYVQVNVIAPGPVLLPEETKKRDRDRILQTIPLKRIGKPEDVAQAVRFLIENDYITGQTLYVDGGRSINLSGGVSADA